MVKLNCQQTIVVNWRICHYRLLISSFNMIIKKIWCLKNIKRIIWSFNAQRISWLANALLNFLGLIIWNTKKESWWITHPNVRIVKFNVGKIIFIQYLGLVWNHKLISNNSKKLNVLQNILLSQDIFIIIQNYLSDFTNSY